MTPQRRFVTKQLGQLLIERKVINEKQLEHALQLQKERGGILGQILVALGYATEDEIAQAITVQYGFPYLPLANYQIDLDVIKLIPEQVARQYVLIPVDRIGSTITVAMFNPMNLQAIEDIELLTKLNVQVFVSTMSDITSAIKRCYGDNANP